MIYKGKHVGYYLYELTETDLMWEDCPRNNYQVGNILLFRNKRDIALGSEHVKADDLPTALAYLDAGLEFANPTIHSSPEKLALLNQQLAEAQTSIDKRDDLLRDLAADLESQRYSNKMLIAQLESLREQISIEQLSRNEVLGDLEIVSAETYRKEQELQRAIDAKTQLEQELAARICELLELDSANAELQKRLSQHNFATASVPVTDSSRPGGTSQEIQTTAVGSALSTQDDCELIGSIGQVYTMPTGKQIHVYHEFPLSRSRRRKRGVSALKGLIRVLGLAILGALLFLAGSVLATARLNDLSLGEALDTTLKALIP